MNTSTAAAAPAPDRRIAAVDALRGLVMVIMALDHTRASRGERSLLS